MNLLMSEFIESIICGLAFSFIIFVILTVNEDYKMFISCQDYAISEHAEFVYDYKSGCYIKDNKTQSWFYIDTYKNIKELRKR